MSIDSLNSKYPSRILGIDYGEKNLGIAITDPTQTIAKGIGNFRVNESNSHLQIVKNVLKEYKDVYFIVLGYPLHLDGNESITSQHTLKFKSELEKECKLMVILMNESYSTKIATKILIEANVSRKKRKLHKDMLAAQIILQRYLDYRDNILNKSKR